MHTDWLWNLCFIYFSSPERNFIHNFRKYISFWGKSQTPYRAFPWILLGHFRPPRWPILNTLMSNVHVPLSSAIVWAFPPRQVHQWSSSLKVESHFLASLHPFLLRLAVSMRIMSRAYIGLGLCEFVHELRP